MTEPGVIQDCLAELSARLPAPVVAELADGLEQTQAFYRARGLAPDAAARAAVAEFGEPAVIVAAFTDALPARRAARRMLAAGPVVGACWGVVLITGRAWDWPVPAGVPITLGLALAAVVGLLAAASFGREYRPVGRAGAAGCLGVTILDATMLAVVPLAVPVMAWPVVMAMAASATRLAMTACALRQILAAATAR